MGISDTSTIRRAPLGERAPWGAPLGPLWGDGNLTGDSWQRRGGNQTKNHKAFRAENLDKNCAFAYRRQGVEGGGTKHADPKGRRVSILSGKTTARVNFSILQGNRPPGLILAPRLILAYFLKENSEKQCFF